MTANKNKSETDRKDAKTQRFYGLRVLASSRAYIAAVLLMWLVLPVYAGWPTYHGEPDLRGVSETTLPEAPQMLWRYQADGAICNTPVSDGERIFFATKKGNVIALNLTGSEVWQKNFMRTNDAGAQVPMQFDAPPASFGGLVLAGTLRGSLIALDARTGAEKWRYETGGTILGSPNQISTNQIAVINQAEGSLHCLELGSGKLLWKTEGVERCDGSPGVGDGRIVFGSCAAALHIYSAADGKHLKDIEVGGDAQIAGGAAVVSNLVFAGARDGRMLCADAEAGDIVWSSAVSKKQTFSTPAVTQDKVVYSSDNGRVYAVTREDGRLLWTFESGGLPVSPVAAGDKVAVSADGVLYLLSLADGRKLWSHEISDDISSPALIGGMLAVGADDGTVTAFGKKE